MSRKKYNIYCLFIGIIFTVLTIQSCGLSPYDQIAKAQDKAAKEKQEMIDKINKAISDQDFLTAYGMVDSYYDMNHTFNKELATTLNKKIVMAEIGSVLELDVNANVKATKIIMLIKERSVFASEEELLDDVIEIVNSLDDKELSSKLIKAKNNK